MLASNNSGRLVTMLSMAIEVRITTNNQRNHNQATHQKSTHIISGVHNNSKSSYNYINNFLLPCACVYARSRGRVIGLCVGLCVCVHVCVW